MEDIEKIKLTPAQRTAYWWVNIIKGKVKALLDGEAYYDTEKKFAKIFEKYTERDWRKLYLKLTEEIEKDIENENDKNHYFVQETEMKKHDRINEELSKITSKPVPDILISTRSTKPMLIYTNKYKVIKQVRSIGEEPLELECEPTYILTGNEKKLDFYYLLVATISALHEKDPKFESIPALANGFCKKYKEDTSNQSSEEIIEWFKDSYDKAMWEGLITGFRWGYSSTYFCSDRLSHYKGLEPYMNQASDFADAILQESKSQEEKPKEKKKTEDK